MLGGAGAFWVPAVAGVLGASPAVACCVPAVAGVLGAGPAGDSSALAIEVAVTF